MRLLLVAIVLLITLPASAAQLDLPAICDSSSEALFTEYRVEYLEASEKLFSQAPEVIAREVFAHTDFIEIVPWRLQVPSRPNVLKAAYLVQLKLAQFMINGFSAGTTPRQVLLSASQSKAIYSPKALEHARLVMTAVRTSRPSFKEEQALIVKNAKLLCAPYLSTGCPKAIGDTLKIMDSRSGGEPYIAGNAATTHPTSLTAIVSDPSLVQGLSYLALRMMDKVEARRPLGKSLFDDLKESFRHFGSSPERAEEQAWTVLTFYSTRGASLAFFEGAANSENLPVWVALYVMSTAMGVIDSETTVTTGHSYSYPAEIGGYCRMDRPYHFWLAASLTRDLIKKGHSPKAAVSAVHIAGKLYEYGASVTGRDGDRIYLDKFLSAYPVMVRIGLAHKTVGALWAAKLNNRPLNFDSALTEIFEESKPMSKDVSKSEVDKASAITKYRWFDRVVAPDSALKKFGPF